ncbi:MAG TPA: AMP-binding protein [Allosphingosinicella sp.]|nr:AMP-binding protein [Allosphingosinicella sp.]
MVTLMGLAPRPDTIGFSIVDAARRGPDRTAFILGERQATYSEFARETISCARSLLALGIERGEHVGILMPNCWDYAILVGAINLIGASAVVLNARYRGEDLEHVVRHSEITLLLTTGLARHHRDLRALLVSCFPELAAWRKEEPLALAGAPLLRRLFHFEAPDETCWPTKADFEAIGSQADDAEFLARVAAVEPNDTALIIFSSGTTARPKACMISHKSVMHVSGAMAERMQLTADDVFWDPLPLYHLASHLPLNACRRVGATFVCQSHFDPASALAQMELVKATICYPAFPALTAALIDHPDFRKRDLSSLRLQLTIGAPELLRKFSKAIPAARQISCYGLTEGGGICTISSPDDPLEQRLTRVGMPLSGFSIRIVDPETLEDRAQGERGEILIKGPVFSGYFKQEDETAKVLLPDGWLRSGDAGWIDEEGQLAYAGRIKDMLKIGGENVAAVEVESFLARHPKVKMAQVISAPDERLVEVVAAYIELNSGETMTEEEVIAHCSGKIASYKIPRYVRFVAEWPMSATKIQKFKLVESFVPEGKIDVGAYMGKMAKTG